MQQELNSPPAQQRGCNRGRVSRGTKLRRQRIDLLKRHKANTLSRHTKGNETAKHRRCSHSVVIQITTTQNLVAVLDQVVLTGFFGTSRAAAAERLLAEAIRDLLKEGTIQKRK